jgi:GTP-binding protein
MFSTPLLPMSLPLKVRSPWYVCRPCTQNIASRPQCRSVAIISRVALKDSREKKTRKTRIESTRKEPELTNNVPRKVSFGPAEIRVIRHPSDSPTPERPDLQRTGGRRRAIRPRRRLAERAETHEPGLGESEGLVPSAPSTLLRAPEQVIESSTPATAVVRPLEHFNWYYETFPPNILQTVRANSYFMGNRNPPKLLSSAARFMQVPDSDVPEVAFVGRSNVGKSSLLNTIVDANVQNLLARTSKTRGFTKTMNFYGIGPGFGVRVEKGDKGRDKIVGTGGLVIVDMPGYGDGSLLSWGVEIMKYIQSRKQLRRVFVLLDADHGIKDKDRSLLASLRLAGVSHQVVLSKMDKLYIPKGTDIKQLQNKKSYKIKAKGTVEALRQEMEKLKPEIKPPHGGGALGEILACSSETLVNGKRLGIDHVRFAILKAVGLEGKTPKGMGRLKDHIEAEEQLEGMSVVEKLSAPGPGARSEAKWKYKARKRTR